MWLVVQDNPAGTGRVGGISNGQNPAGIVMDHVHAEHLTLPLPRAFGA
jgi:hypothetical protein